MKNETENVSFSLNDENLLPLLRFSFFLRWQSFRKVTTRVNNPLCIWYTPRDSNSITNFIPTILRNGFRTGENKRLNTHTHSRTRTLTSNTQKEQKHFSYSSLCSHHGYRGTGCTWNRHYMKPIDFYHNSILTRFDSICAAFRIGKCCMVRLLMSHVHMHTTTTSVPDWRQ